MKHILTAHQFSKKELNSLFTSADKMRFASNTTTGRKVLAERHKGKLVATMFHEPSTRTRLSFESAAMRLGMGVISTENAGGSSSAVKGESIEDATRVVSSYVDIIVLRHPEEGAVQKAAKASSVPLINAGDGTGEHPTQALLDAFTIKSEIGSLDDLHVALVGDLLHSRTMHSLLVLLEQYGPELLLISPDQLRLGNDWKDELSKKDVRFKEADNLEALNDTIDVVYCNRIQKERFKSAAEYEKLKHYFILGPTSLKKLKAGARILDPLPRIGEIEESVDDDPRAAYFRQAENGLYVRMALLDSLI